MLLRDKSIIIIIIIFFLQKLELCEIPVALVCEDN